MTNTDWIGKTWLPAPKPPSSGSHVHTCILLSYTTSFLSTWLISNAVWFVSSFPCCGDGVIFFSHANYESRVGWENTHSNLHMVSIIKWCLHRDRTTPSSGVLLSLLICSEALHACWAVERQMVGGRWVMSSMLFPLKGTQLRQNGRVSSMNCSEATQALVGWWKRGLPYRWNDTFPWGRGIFTMTSL